MKKKKHPIPIILFILAAIIVILGIVQLALYISPQLTMLEEAAAQGATAEQISEYYWQQLIPQIVTYIITSLGIAALLFSSGVIYQKLSQLLNSAFNFFSERLLPKDEIITENKKEISDDFFNEFEISEEERK
ncbi:hypothetical protein [Clostridium culturomicium]|uniref:hypothetical protein n=1 Tax=Clostridium culturomicium TaxID=1499683 RepID=UPI00058B3F9A|nr:hypothetical protein [Clostridium culturomicium]